MHIASIRGLFLLITLSLTIHGLAQNSFLQGQVHKGNTVVHTTAVENIAGAQPIGIELIYGKTFANKFYHYNTGWSLQYTNYGSSIVGNSVIASRYIEPTFKLFSSISGSLKTSFGIAYLNSPNTGKERLDNQNYALYINPYLHVGIGLQGSMGKRLGWIMQGNFHHISNGNIKQPNKGLNWITATAGIRYYINKNERLNEQAAPPILKKVIQQVGLQWVPQQGYFAKWKGQRTLLLGTFYQMWKPVTTINAIGVGAEIQYQRFQQDNDAIPISSPWVIGLHAGHNFLLGRVQFSQQIGYTILNPIHFLPSFYHRWGITYQIKNHWQIGANLKANSDNADFFDLRLSYQW